MCDFKFFMLDRVHYQGVCDIFCAEVLQFCVFRICQIMKILMMFILKKMVM